MILRQELLSSICNSKDMLNELQSAVVTLGEKVSKLAQIYISTARGCYPIKHFELLYDCNSYPVGYIIVVDEAVDNMHNPPHGAVYSRLEFLHGHFSRDIHAEPKGDPGGYLFLGVLQSTYKNARYDAVPTDTITNIKYVLPTRDATLSNSTGAK